MSQQKQLLAKARAALKRQDWDSAVSAFEQMICQSGASTAEVYAGLARSYRRLGSMKAAERTITSGLEQHPSSTRILTEQYWLYRHTSSWRKAQATAQQLVSLYPKHSEYRFRLGLMHVWLKDQSAAADAYYRGLELKHAKGRGLSKILSDIQAAIRQYLDLPDGDITTEFSVLQGKNNLGMFQHETSQHGFVTKVVQAGRVADREAFFYQQVQPSAQVLESVAPPCIDVRVVDGLTYITLERLDGTPSRAQDCYQVLATTQNLAQLSYETMHWVGQRTYNIPKTQKSPLALMPFLTQLDDPYTAEALFSQLKYLFKYYGYPQSAHQVVDRLTELVIGNELYAYIIRACDFVVVHGDFIADNTMIESADEPAALIDWASFTLGPKGLDFARWAASSRTRIPYSTVQENYLDHPNNRGSEARLEMILFLLAYILFQLVETRKTKEAIHQDLSTRMPQYILPALADLEHVVYQFLNDPTAPVQRLLQQFTEQHKRYEMQSVDMNALQKENQQLKKNMQELHNTIGDLPSAVAQLTAITQKLKDA